ncbi:MAG: hypothetical protein LIO71_10390 [Ruminococcus sp.]|nr:hypothetical protein [Ruminococcus sp.]MCD7800191.1 hypothetical protein [Ruminococcus sp.]
MGWFSKDNDEDIDDIYNRLDDIYSKLEMLDVVTAFSGRLSRLEKTSTYLESVLMETVKELEKRIEVLESTDTARQPAITDSVKSTSEIDKVKYQVDFLKEDIQMLRKSLNDSINENSKGGNITQRMNDMDGVIKNLTLKISYLELAKDRSAKIDTNDIAYLKDELSQKDEQIKILNKKIESLTYIIEEDSRNIKMVAKHIIDQANAMKSLREEISILRNGDKTFQ